ncbi:AMP-binding protein [Nocardia sp. Marseille-Q1738]
MSTIADDAQRMLYRRTAPQVAECDQNPELLQRRFDGLRVHAGHAFHNATVQATTRGADAANVLTAEDRRRLLDEWSTGVELSDVLSVAELIRRGRAIPGIRTAIRCGAASLSYGELFGRLDGALADRPSADAINRLIRLLATLGNDAAGRGVAVGPVRLPGAALAAAVADRRAVAAECRGGRGDPAFRPADVRLLAAECGEAEVAVEMLAALADGSTLVVATESQRANPAELVELIVRHAVTHVVASAETVAQIVHTVPELSTIRRWDVIGAEPVAVLPGRLAAVSAMSVATAAYTVPAYAGSVARGTLDGTGRTRPIPGARVLVLDASRQPVPPGVIGEVYVGGAALGTGGGDPPAVDRFVADPFLPEGRLFRTHDRAHWTTDGWLIFS